MTLAGTNVTLPDVIAHRGCLDGPDPARENLRAQLWRAQAEGFAVEVDVRWHLDGFWLGHDAPQERVLEPQAFFQHPGVYAHAKDGEALCALLDLGAHCFALKDDAWTVTSRGLIWSGPLEIPLGGVLQVELGRPTPARVRQLRYCQAVCTDYPREWRAAFVALLGGTP